MTGTWAPGFWRGARACWSRQSHHWSVEPRSSGFGQPRILRHARSGLATRRDERPHPPVWEPRDERPIRPGPCTAGSFEPRKMGRGLAPGRADAVCSKAARYATGSSGRSAARVASRLARSASEVRSARASNRHELKLTRVLTIVALGATLLQQRMDESVELLRPLDRQR